MSLEIIPGQPRTKRFLRRIFGSSRVPHSLLFTGMSGVGKSIMAREFAKLLNCVEPKGFDCCEECSSCRKMDGGVHPDFVWIKRDGTYIKLDQIRDLQQHLRYRPFEGRRRVFLIQDASDLREEAANALLKILEEPPKENILVLTALEPQMLLPTIVSRCCHVRFQPLDDSAVEDHLVNALQLPPSQARKTARMAEGSLERARWLAQEGGLARWKEILAHVEKLKDLPMIDFFALMGRWVKQSEDLERDLECIKLWVRDLVLAKVLADHQPAFETDSRVLHLIAGVSTETLFALYDRMERALQHLRQNANKQLVMEGVCLAIKDGLYGQSSWNSLSQGGQSLSL